MAKTQYKYKDMAFDLIQIDGFPETSALLNWLVTAGPDGEGKKISLENVKAELGIDALMQFGGAIVPASTPPVSGDFFWIATEEGTYTNYGGVVVPAGSLAVISRVDGVFTSSITTIPQPENRIDDWEAGTYNQGDQRIHNGQIWSVDVASTTEEPGVGSDWVANTDAGAEVIDNLETPDPDAALSAKQGVEIRPRILPEGKMYLNIDRPDLDPIFGGLLEVDKYGFILDGNISRKVLAHDNLDRPDLKHVQVDKEGYIIDEKLSGIAGDDLNKLIVRSDIDRPDLALIVLDKYEKIILELPMNIAPSDPEDAVNTYINPINPLPQEAFSQNDDFLTDYDIFQQGWLDLMNTQVVNPDIAPYVSRTNKGKSSTKNLDIWRYDFKPESPKNKIFLIAGTHASEKNYIQGVYNFCKMLLDPDIWTRDKDLERLRFETHFIVYPCLSPSSFFGFIPNSIGGRRPWETDDFPVSWTKAGGTVTVSFETADFPDTGGRLDADTYFSQAGLAGKLQVALFDSSDETGLPNDGYVIQSVINGRTITVNAPSGGPSNGTARMYVGTDPNRNMDIEGFATWINFTPSTTSLLQYSNDHVAYANDNKGTRPFSLSELIILRDDLLEESDFLFYLDCHSGSGKHYLARSAVYEPTGYGTALGRIKYYIAQFSSTDFSAIRTDIATTPFTSNYIAREMNKQGYTIEWNQLATTNIQDATDSLRWMTTVIIELLKLKN